MPSARFYNEAAHGITIYDGAPDQKITMTSFPYNWMEASFFYMNATNSLLCRKNLSGKSFCQNYKDKGFNFKFRLKEEDNFPAVAIGVNDVAGTGFYSSEYIVGSYGINMTDFHFGLGWGTLNNLRNDFINPLTYLYNGFNNRPYTDPVTFEAQGGQFQLDRYFSGKTVSPFFGLSHIISNKLAFKLEYDTTLTPGLVSYQIPKSDFTYAFELNINDSFIAGLSYERGNYTSFKFIYKNNPKVSKPEYKYKKPEFKGNSSKYSKLIKNLEANGIGVNKILETPKVIGLELSQFSHPNLDIVENIIRSASFDAGIKKPIKKELRVANLQGISEYNKEFKNNSLLIYQRKSKRSFNTKTNLTFYVDIIEF